MFKLHATEAVPFDMILSSIIGMNLHPGTTRDPPSKRTLEECFDLAVKIIKMKREKVYVDYSWSMELEGQEQ